MKLDAAYQVSFAMFIAAHLVAALVVRPNPRYVAVSALAYALFVVLFLGVVKLFERHSDRAQFHEQLEAQQEEVFALSQAQAKDEALQVLLDKKTFQVEEASDANPPDRLPPSLREFFSKYDQIRAVRGGLQLSRKFIKPRRKRFVQIGEEEDFVEIVVRPNHETVYELESDGTYICDYPSIYHLILLRNKDYN